MSMQSESRWVIERFGVRGARLALIAAGVIFLVLVGIWAATEVASAWRGAHFLRVLTVVAVVILAVFLSVRVMAVNWRATRAAADQPVMLPDGADQTDVWGVGGPSMREPGSTGAWPMRNVDRRYEDRGD